MPKRRMLRRPLPSIVFAVGPGKGTRDEAGPEQNRNKGWCNSKPFAFPGEACRSYRGSLWLLRKAGGLDRLASSSSHYTCEKLLAANRPIPARRERRLLGAASARIDQALWGECLADSPKYSPPCASVSTVYAEIRARRRHAGGPQWACSPPKSLVDCCWPRRA